MPTLLTYNYDPGITSGPMAGVMSLRRWLSDTDFSSVPTQPGQVIPRAQMSAIYSDQEYLAFINDKGGDLIYAWAHILMAIATNNALLSVYVNLGGGGTVDFSKAAPLLIQTAKEILDMYAMQPAAVFSEVDSGALSAWRIFSNQILRQM